MTGQPEMIDIDLTAEKSHGSQLDEIVRALGELRDELAATNERAAARERVIDRLHEENQRLRAGERQDVLRPVITDVYRLRDDLLHQAGALPEDFDAERAARLLRSYAHSLELSLERCGVLPVAPAVGDPFDPRLHRAVTVVPAGDLSADGAVVAVLGEGYRDAVTERVLALATVRVARWIPQT